MNSQQGFTRRLFTCFGAGLASLGLHWVGLGSSGVEPIDQADPELLARLRLGRPAGELHPERLVAYESLPAEEQQLWREFETRLW